MTIRSRLARFLGIKTDRDIAREVLSEPVVREAVRSEQRGRRVLRELKVLENKHNAEISNLIDDYENR